MVVSTPLEQRLDRLPDRRLPVVYFVFAHLCLLAACLAFATAPRALVGFFYHPKMVAVVHLVTAVVFVLVNLAVDLLYGWLDPRIRYERTEA